MKHPLFVAISAGLLWLLVAGVAYEARAAQSPLVVRVTTDRHVYRLRRRVLIILTETNTPGSSCRRNSALLDQE